MPPMLHRKPQHHNDNHHHHNNTANGNANNANGYSPIRNTLKLSISEDHDVKKTLNQSAMRRRKNLYKRIRVFIVTSGILALLYHGYYEGRRYIQSRVPSVSFENPNSDDSSSQQLRGSNESDEGATIQPEVCFITASYSKKKKEMDKLLVINNKSPYLRFYLFTNLNDQEWSTPGWTKIVTHFKYRRIITHSRYGKFLGWKEPEIQECKAVFYMDACLRPSENQTMWRELADIIATDETGTGLMQWPHPKNRSGVIGEFLAIKDSKKDIDKNIVKSLQWMIAQEDLDVKAKIYMNENFGYDPNSQVYRELSQAFWDQYSLEEDSWRDQPLWAFMLHRYNITPIPYPVPYKQVWQRNDGRALGHHGHAYTSEKDVLA
ncbi:unnamed protein product [Cylindrotheca closterium]|uniref:Uncharacterized protein n=1 Tax=Cylindrotheca closterium TaxID=2856 RepID=A0AAD2JJJ4_9STRA|nr:unnamed protein product [Cylindrotheca closterium]